MKKFSSILHIIPVLALFLLASAGCNTGIESTKTIKMSKSERKETMPTAEENFVSSLKSESLGSWRRGKRFVVVDDKAALILEMPVVMHADSLRGHILRFDGIESRQTPGGEDASVIRFLDGGRAVRYNTGRKAKDSEQGISGLDIPMVVDLDMVALADSLLRQRQFWIRTQLWYDKEGHSMNGRKFVPVTIERVRAGNKVFPLLVDFVDDKGTNASIFMNVRASDGLGAESRTFPTLFYMTDPKLSYPSVTPEVWSCIQQGKVEQGMTKEECKLALGNPSEVDGGHTWSNLIDIWRYKDGTFLQFENGLLVNFRH